MAKQKKAQEVSAVRQAKHGWIITLLFAVLSNTLDFTNLYGVTQFI